MSLEEDFREFVAARQRGLLRTAWLLTGDWTAAEDLVQTALMRAWPHWRRLAGQGAAERYVRRIMVNSFNSGWRRRWRRETPTSDLPHGHAPDAYGAVDLRQSLAAAVRALPPRQRAVVALRFFDDLTEAQIADVMGVAVGTVKSQTSKALASLRTNPALNGLNFQESAT